MLVAEEAVEIRVLSRQGKSIRAIARPRGLAQHGAALSAEQQAAALRVRRGRASSTRISTISMSREQANLSSRPWPTATKRAR